MKTKKKEPIFKNAVDPATAEKLPEVMPVAPLILETDTEFEKLLKEKNITEDDLHFLKSVKLNTSIDSNSSYRLWQIHLRIFGFYPQMNDRFCSACVSKCITDVWENIAPIYSKYILKQE